MTTKMIEKEQLMKLGFNKNEAKVYLSLIRFGKADAGQLIKDTKFHKNIVYDNLEKLIDKGLVSFIIEEGRRVFQIASSDSLIQLFEDKEKALLKRRQIAEEISKEIEKTIKKIPEKQEAGIYRGIKGIKSFYNESLKGKDYVVFGAPQESIDIMGELFWTNYNTKRIDNRINVRMIFNPSIKRYGDTIKNKFTEVRYFERDFEPATETHVQGDKIGIIVWAEEPVLFLIQDKRVASSYLSFFEKMWKLAKK